MRQGLSKERKGKAIWQKKFEETEMEWNGSREVEIKVIKS